MKRNESDSIKVIGSSSLPEKTWYIRGNWTKEEIEALKNTATKQGFDVKILRDPKEICNEPR